MSKDTQRPIALFTGACGRRNCIPVLLMEYKLSWGADAITSRQRPNQLEKRALSSSASTRLALELFISCSATHSITGFHPLCITYPTALSLPAD